MTCKRLLQSNLGSFFVIWFAMGCIPTATTTITTTATLTPEPPTSTLTLVAPTENTRWANYGNSFEEITDTSVIAIPNKNSSISINKENARTGKQSLEVRKVGSPQEFSIDFWISSITGDRSMDISAKAISISVFIPTDSPIETINFGFSGKGGTIVVPVREFMGIKGRWFREAINMAEVAHNSRTEIYGNSWDGALSIIQNCEIISLVGKSSSDSRISTARFRVDDFAWSNWVEPMIHPEVDSLQKYAPHGMKIGSLFFDYFLLDPSFSQALLQEFNLGWMATRYPWFWPNEEPEDPTNLAIDYSNMDRIVNMASTHHLNMKMFTGGWHLQLPKWLLDTPFDQLKPVLENRVAKDVGHYTGKMFMWDVFDEATVDFNIGTPQEYAGFRNRQHIGSPSIDGFAPYGYDYSPWVDGQDTSIIKAAFYKARETDPNAKLFLNEYDNEQKGKPKSEFFYQFVSDMRHEGVPIDGVGFQMHLFIWGNTNTIGFDQTPIDTYLKNVDQNVKRYEDLGLLVEFSEVEVEIRTDDLDLTTSLGRDLYDKRLNRQAELYSGLMKIAKEHKNVAAFIFWEISDTWSTIVDNIYWPTHEIFGNAALFDTYYQPKPAYYAVLKLLKGERSS